MDIQISNQPVEFDLYGISGDVTAFDYAGTGMKLMDLMWQETRDAGLKHNGINCWVYDSSTRMFAGVELENGEDAHGSLEHKPVSLTKYAYFKHVGPYEKLGDIHRKMEAELAKRSLSEIGPRVEKYGHWTEEQSKLVTEVYIAIK